MTNDDKALVERLRSRVSNREMLLVDPPRPAPDRDCHHAADRIEAQAAELAELKAAKWKERHVDTMNDMASLRMERDDLHAENERLRRLLLVQPSNPIAPDPLLGWVIK